MSRLLLEIHDDAVAAIDKIRRQFDTGIELELPQGSVLFESSINLKLIKKEAEKLNKSVHFKTSDETGRNLINLLDEPIDAISGFASKEVELTGKEPKPKKKFNIRKPKLTLPTLKKFNFAVLGVVVSALLVLTVGVYLAFWRVPKAEVKLVVNSQPLIKSISIKIKDSASTSANARILKGKLTEASLTDTLSAKTTGEIEIGEKAVGRIKIYNKTTSAKTFDKGDEIVYKDGDRDLVYILDDGVTVPARVDSDPDPENPEAQVIITPGEAEADVIAKEFGNSYNLNSGKNLEFDDYKIGDFIGTVIENIDGGSTDTVSVVVEEDQAKLSTELFLQLSERAPTALESKIKNVESLVKGSEVVSIVSEEYDAEIGDQVEEIELTQSVAMTGLVYDSDELNNLLDELIEEFIPDGFVLSSDERDVNVEVLGNSETTILSSTEADLQVTLKSFVILDIDEKELKEKLVNKPLSEAEKILGGVRNIKTYELNVSPNIPFLQRLPSNIENISLEVKRE